jgi:GxxExxY protein
VRENEISGLVVNAAIEVHRALGGPGLLEKVYEEALAYDLSTAGLRIDRQKLVPILYKGVRLSTALRVDLVVGQKVIVECKACTFENPIFEAQALTYLRLLNLKLALVINFGRTRVKEGIHRIVNGL